MLIGVFLVFILSTLTQTVDNRHLSGVHLTSSPLTMGVAPDSNLDKTPLGPLYFTRWIDQGNGPKPSDGYEGWGK
jgi:hypothetical protein